MEETKISEAELIRIFTNPFYAINIHPELALDHPFIVSEEEFVRVAVNLIKEIGVEEYVKNMLENLKGNYITNK